MTAGTRISEKRYVMVEKPQNPPPSPEPPTGPDRPSGLVRRFLRTLKPWLPATEVLILFVGLACTVGCKLFILIRQQPENLLNASALIVLPDLLFFAFVYLLIHCLYALRPSRFMARCAMIIAALVTLWSILNLCWLIDRGVQLQPGVIKLLFVNFKIFAPIVGGRLIQRWFQSILVILALLAVGTFFGWRLYHPPKVIPRRSFHLRRAGLITLVILFLFFLLPVVRANSNLGFSGEIIGFSSHWYALVSTVYRPADNNHKNQYARQVPRLGQRQVTPPDTAPRDLPNIVLVLLESVSRSATSLADPDLNNTPFLARLALEGAEFSRTRIPISHTDKAFWAALTGSTPIVRPDYAEAVPMDTPYEGLPSLLARAGYRSAFFQMVNGAFECAPGFFHNLAFDWAWFRENLGDPTAHMGYLGGDDRYMIEPAVQWLENDDQPAFLMMITSVSHDPFEVPANFGPKLEDPYQAYLQTVRYTDHFLEQLYRTLERQNLTENLLLCVMGDHGTSFRVKTGMGRWIPYEEVIRVPWLIHWPGRVAPAQRYDWPCSQLDLAPTLLHLVGFDIARAGFDGRNAFDLIESNRRLYFSSWFENSPIGFVEEDRKIVFWPYTDKVFLYDLVADPLENNPRQLPLDQAQTYKRDILQWQNDTDIYINAKRYREYFLFSHWHTFCSGRSAWAYYVP